MGDVNVEVLEEYIAWVDAGNHAYNTVRSYRATLTTLMGLMVDDLGILDWAALDIRGVERLMEIRGQDLRPNSINTHLAHISAFNDWLRYRGYHIKYDNSTLRLLKKKVIPRKRYELTDDEKESLFKKADHEHPCYGALLRVLSSSGARISEVLSLKRGDYIPGDTINSVRVFESKTNNFHDKPISSEANTALFKWLSMTQLGGENDWLFYHPRRGKPITASLVNSLIDRWRRSIGILVRISCHDFRRNYVTKLIKAGIPLADVQALSGHRSLVSMQRYLISVNKDLAQKYLGVGMK